MVCKSRKIRCYIPYITQLICYLSTLMIKVYILFIFVSLLIIKNVFKKMQEHVGMESQKSNQTR